MVKKRDDSDEVIQSIRRLTELKRLSHDRRMIELTYHKLSPADQATLKEMIKFNSWMSKINHG